MESKLKIYVHSPEKFIKAQKFCIQLYNIGITYFLNFQIRNNIKSFIPETIKPALRTWGVELPPRW